MSAPNGNKNARGNKGGGRKALYRPEFAKCIEKLAKLGATDKEMADYFDVSLTTFKQWKIDHIEFADRLKKGKLFADAEVADKLFQRATGYSHLAVKLIPLDGQVVRERYTEHYPPDTTAAIFWLKNRQPKLWRAQPDDRDAPQAPLPVKVVVDIVDARVRQDAET